LLNCISIYTVLGTSSSSLSLLSFIFLDDEKSIIATWRIAEGMEDSLRRTSTGYWDSGLRVSAGLAEGTTSRSLHGVLYYETAVTFLLKKEAMTW
jgi:hypothetical protein